ncbi:S8 family serine peptidase, partial [Caulobacter sp. 17J65-9]|uniref:S8 family serine peptidase n=1 Tax=Caulobacter sp. 17J65-9 TaxID=2709382 RepID=UPI0013CA765F
MADGPGGRNVLARVIAGILAALLLGGPADGQVRLPDPVGRLPVVPDVLERLPDPGRVLTDARALADQRLDRLNDLARRYPRDLELDERNAPVVRGEILALSPSPAALEQAKAAGFTVLREERLEPLDLPLVVLRAPDGWSARRAVNRLREADPQGGYDYNHVYGEAGVAPVAAAAATAVAGGSDVRVGLIDTGVDARHPALAGARIEPKAFAAGGWSPKPHGTAVASLLAGRTDGFRGAAPGATVMAADVYGNTPRGGSAESVARALAWMAETRTPVVNVSLVGPPNAAVKAAVEALLARGHLIVAAVGNDGPAAPAAYPASYPGVIAVTGVDRRRKVLIEAGRAEHLDFAAPGADMAAAAPGGLANVRGTSYAAPLVAGRLALRLARPDRKA